MIDWKNQTFLAPMAGVSDLAFRQLCRHMGADMAYSEMVSAKAMQFGDKKTFRLLCFDGEPRPNAVQLFGHEPDVVAEAAKRVSEFADVIDINMGCPAPKITGGGDGCALMRDPLLAGRIVEKAVKASSVPVTVKIRKGWDTETAPFFARAMWESGAAAVTVHGRTAKEQYGGIADRGTIRRVKEAVGIPVIGNGDIRTAADAFSMREETGCDSVMIGRGAMGNPFLFREIREMREYGGIRTKVTLRERVETCLWQIRKMEEYKGAHTAALEARKHASWYIRGVKGASAVREKLNRAASYAEMEQILYDFLRRQEKEL